VLLCVVAVRQRNVSLMSSDLIRITSWCGASSEVTGFHVQEASNTRKRGQRTLNGDDDDDKSRPTCSYWLQHLFVLFVNVASIRN